MRHRSLLVLPAVIIFMLARVDALGGEPAVLHILVDKEGKVYVTSPEGFEKGLRAVGASEGTAETSWGGLAERVLALAEKAPGADSSELPEPAPRPVTLQLRWVPKKKRCNVFAGYGSCGSNSSGISKARTKIKKSLGKSKGGVAIDTDESVPLRWFLSAVEMARKLDRGGIRFLNLPSLKDIPGLAEAVRKIPLRAPSPDALPDVTVKVLGDRDLPFRHLGAILGFCSRVGVFKVWAGPSPGRLVKTFLPGPSGGANGVEKAVLHGLTWLKNHQEAGGAWSCDRFMERCGGEPCKGKGQTDEYDLGLTALSLLAFLGAGHTQSRGDFQETVGRAVGAVLEEQDGDGCFGEKFGNGHWIYNHAFCALALAEAFSSSSGDEKLQAAVQKAVDFLVKCQNPGMGWRYGIQTGFNDTSCTAASVEALLGARRNGFRVPQEALEGALAYIKSVTVEEYFLTGYTSKGDSGARLASAVDKFEPCETMTAAAIVSRILIQGRGTIGSKENLGAGRIVLSDLPAWKPKKIDMYYWFWGTSAMFKLGGKFWRPWREALHGALLPNQRKNGCAGGSWDPVGAWGVAGGRVFATALNVLTLEVEFQYLAVFRD